jgi:hypothetical protein
MYAASGIMQTVLLIMCFVWKARQKKLGIDDFGNPVAQDAPPIAPAISDTENQNQTRPDATEETPLLKGR